MVKGGQQLVMPATVTPNGREAAQVAGQANIINQMNANEPFVGGSESVTVPQFSGSPAANAASVTGNYYNMKSSADAVGDCHATGSCMVGGKRRRKSKKSRKGPQTLWAGTSAKSCGKLACSLAKVSTLSVLRTARSSSCDNGFTQTNVFKQQMPVLRPNET